jgi:uncharacterized membrane protein (UPF0182 family)
VSTVRMSLPHRRRWPLILIIGFVLLAIVFTLMSQFYIDLLWFKEVDFSGVFWATIRTKVVLGVVFGLLFFAVLYVNLLIVRRVKPVTRILTPDQEAIERIRQGFEPYLRWLLPLGAAVLALLVGIGVSGQWQTFLLWRNSAGVAFGTPEPLFHRDPAFYIFTLPWLRFLQGWLFSTLVGVTFLTTIGYFLFGGITPQAPGGLGQKVDPAVRAHLSVLLGLIMLVKAWGYYLGRFDLLTSKRGVVEGASYTDVHAQLPALNFLAIVAVICAILFLVNIRVRIWALPIIAVGLLAVVSVLLGTAYPAFVQQFQVKPQEFEREQPYIRDNIAGTQAAFALDQVDLQQRKVDPKVSATDIRNNPQTVSNIRLWRPSIMGENFQQLQRIRQYYEFRDVDVDRYQIDAEPRVVMVSGREVTQAGIPTGGGTWQNQHLVYTHGFGAVAAPVNQATTEGAPDFILKDIPPVGQPTTSQPRIYYGEGVAGDTPFVVTNTNTPELDYEGGPPVPYTGGGGIPMGNALQRALFAWRYRDINLLISSQIRSDSRIMINRDLAQRVPKAVPFLSFDADPYLVVTPDGMDWVWDAYTTTSQYPYSQAVPLSTATDGAMTGTVNYMRNSVKAVLDAYTGKITYYADLSDPIIEVWNKAFPGLFQPREQADAFMQAHFRYPENLFQVQATQYANYHVTDPETFYRKTDFWEIPDDPTLAAASSSGAAAIDAGVTPKLRPYYVLLKIPGQSTEHFELTMPFVPQGRQNMVAWMAADSDPSEYGQMTAFRFPSGQNIDGPSQVFSRINQDATFSAQRSLLGQSGSEVLFGDFLTVPVENSFLYVLPVYVRSTQTTAVPELKRVVVANGDAIGLGNTFAEALANSITGEIGGGGGSGGNGGGGGTTQDKIDALLLQALDHFQKADTALRAGNLALYQSELQQAKDAVAEAAKLSASQTGGSAPAGSPSPSVAPSASPSP